MSESNSLAVDNNDYWTIPAVSGKGVNFREGTHVIYRIIMKFSRLTLEGDVRNQTSWEEEPVEV